MFPGRALAHATWATLCLSHLGELFQGDLEVGLGVEAVEAEEAPQGRHYKRRGAAQAHLG